LKIEFRLRETWTTTTTLDRYWEFYNVVDTAPGQSEYVANFGNTSANDELHIVIVDEDGKFTGEAGQILEVYRNLSRAEDAKTNDGAALYYKTALNDRSAYVWWANDRSGAASNNATNVASSTNSAALNISFSQGQDGFTELAAPLGLIASGYDLFCFSRRRRCFTYPSG